VSRQARAFGFATANAARQWAGKAIASVPTAAPRTSWWLDQERANFTARAEQEREAMDGGVCGKSRRPSMPVDRRTT
jgi:hypothetical protein